jgi:Ser/Thr protein kinase RdoA (MazF antagonist)
VGTDDADDADALERMRRLGEARLRERYGGSPILTVIDHLTSEHLVVRCTVVDGAPGTPTSVILKHLPPDDDDSGQRSWRAQRFANEWAALTYLASLPTSMTFAPRLHTGDLAERLMVIEDLGPAGTLQELLFGTDADAEEQLVRFGHQLGLMHAATRGREAEFASSQAAAGARSPLSDATWDLRTERAVLEECLGALGVVPTAAFMDAAFAVEAAMHDPASPWRALAHGDLGPHNALLCSPGPVFLDFEFAHFGHGLVDAVGARMAFPQAYHGRRSPLRAIEQLEHAYREALAAAVPEAADDERFMEAVVQACAHWALSRVRGVRVTYDQKPDRTPEQIIESLGRTVTYLRAFIATAEKAGRETALRTTLREVVDALHTRWPAIEPLPVYPALS